MPTLLRRLERAAERDTALTFVVGGGEDVVTWRELHADARRYAAALQAGVRAGDHVALLAHHLGVPSRPPGWPGP